jgi:hypothetical protein
MSMVSKGLGAGLATIALAGVGAGIGIVCHPEKYTQQAGRGGCSRPGHLHLDPIRLGVNG